MKYWQFFSIMSMLWVIYSALAKSQNQFTFAAIMAACYAVGIIVAAIGRE